jgi:hypothetical protein
LSGRIISPSLRGCVPGGSPMTNVLTHIRASSRSFYIIDIKNAFPSVNPKKLVVAVQALMDDSDGEVSQFLHRYFINSWDGGIYTGAPASPLLFNLFVQYWLNPELEKICSRRQLCFTSYLDDFCFSAIDGQHLGRKTRSRLREVLINSGGFRINDEKTRFQDDVTRQSFEMTGITIKHNSKLDKLIIGVNQRYIDTVIAEIEAILSCGCCIHADIGRIRGKVASVRYIADHNAPLPYSSKELTLFMRFHELMERIKTDPDFYVGDSKRALREWEEYTEYLGMFSLESECDEDENFL